MRDNNYHQHIRKKAALTGRSPALTHPLASIVEEELTLFDEELALTSREAALIHPLATLVEEELTVFA